MVLATNPLDFVYFPMQYLTVPMNRGVERLGVEKRCTLFVAFIVLLFVNNFY